ncbi:MAG: prepilin-type N-terminal cleavage/methylation domain-containing protein [Planctomycetota bacterium]
MILPTGLTRNRYPPLTGFTLLEVLVSISILAIFLVSIYQCFIIIFDVLIKTDNYNQSVLLAEEKLYLLTEVLKQDEELADLSGEVKEGTKVFKWETLVAKIDSHPDLRQVEITVNWQQGTRQGRVNLATYLPAGRSIGVGGEAKPEDEK